MSKILIAKTLFVSNIVHYQQHLLWFVMEGRITAFFSLTQLTEQIVLSFEIEWS